MLKKLIIAVFVLSLVLAFSGTAISGPGNQLIRVERPAQVNNVDKAAYVEKTNEAPAGFVGDVSAITDTHGPSTINGQKSLDTSGCAFLDYADWAGAWYTTKLYETGRKFSLRYDVSENHIGTLYEAYIDVRWASDTVNGDGTGGCGLTVEVWDDAGGAPNNLLWSEYIPPEDIPMDAYFYQLVEFNGGAGVNVGYGPYHVSIMSVNCTDPNDYVRVYLNQNADGTDNGRSYMYYPPDDLWYDFLTAFGIPLHMTTIAYACQDYSVCYSKEIVSGGYVLSIPYYGVYTGGSDINGFGQRFTSETAETLNTLIIWVYNHPSNYYAPTTQLNGFDVMVVADDGAGNPDPTTVLAMYNVPAGLNNVYPPDGAFGWHAHVFDMSALNLVFVGPWHVLCKTTGDNPADGRIGFVLDDTDSDANFVGGSVNFVNPAEGNWQLFSLNYTWMNLLWGADAAMDYAPIVCLDEFSVCQWQILYNALSVGGVLGPVYYAQKVQGININRVQEIWTVITEPEFWGLSFGRPPIDFLIWADNGGLPGAVLYQTQLLPDDYDFPSTYGWVNLVIPDVQVVGDFFVGIMVDFTDPADDFVMAYDYNTTNINGGGKYSMDGLAWGDLATAMGDPSANLIFEVNFCSIPFVDRVCDPLDVNWPTLQHDQQRSGASFLGVGEDAYCDLTKNASWLHPTSGASSVGPIIYDGKAVFPFNTGEYAVFDLANMAAGPLYTLGGFSTLYSVPSIFEVGGNPYLYLAGGSTTGIYCYDFSTTPATLVWSIDAGNSFLGHPMASLDGTSYTNFMMLNDGVDDILYFSTNNGRILAAYALTGLPYAGWSGVGNQYKITGFSPSVARGATNDGIGKLFFGYQNAPKGGVLALDAFTGTLLWNFTGTSLKGSEVYGVTISVEGMDAGIAYDNGNVYAMSTCIGDHPVDAVFYSLNAATGEPNYYKAANYMRYAQTPIVDINNIYCQTYSRWYNPPILGGAIYSLYKPNGNVVWLKSWGNFTADNRFYNEIILTCEPDGIPDQIYAFSEHGYLHCINSVDGSEYFRRLIDYGATYGQNIGGGGAIAADALGDLHIVFQTWYGGIVDLTKQTPRPRLQINNFTITKGVSFGVDPAFPVVFDDFYTNTGCIDLNVTLDIFDAPVGSTHPPVAAVSDDLERNATRLAAQMNENKLGMYLLEKTVSIEDGVNLRDVSSKAGRNPAALAAPAFVAVDHYVMPPLAPGASADFSLIVDQNELTRGIQTCYVQFTSDDPDYYLNDPVADAGLPGIPEVTINIIGGCLIEKADLHFGESQQWTKSVSNTGRIGNRDDEATWTPACWDIGGDDASYYAGAHYYAVGQYRVAMNSQDWLTGTTPLDGEDAIYASMQADPNYVSDDCVPAVNTGVNMGTIAYTQGGPYTTLYGNTVHTTILDSVQNWDPGDGWDWSHIQDFFGPFDNDLTMGLKANVITIGVYGDAALNGTLHNCVIKVWNFKERNGNAVEGWYFGTYQDPDISGTGSQTGGYYAPASLCWTYTPGGTVVNGAVKIPFGCGQEPAINTIHFWGNQSGDGAGFFAYVYWDSLYFYSDHYYQTFFHNVAGQSGGDGESHYTLAKHDFEPHGEYLFATALFQLTGVSNPASPTEMIPLANMVNKFMGWGRGDVNNDNVIDLRDIVYMINYVYNSGPGPWPFQYLGNMNPNVDANYDLIDIMFLIHYYFEEGPCPDGYWKHVSPIWDANFE